MARISVRTVHVAAALALAGLVATHSAARAEAPAGKPNILVIFGDDIGISQVSASTMGLMGYWTPNIDGIAKEGVIFTDSYGQQSCTAGRASFILGQEPFRTGLLTIGPPSRLLNKRSKRLTAARRREHGIVGRGHMNPVRGSTVFALIAGLFLSPGESSASSPHNPCGSVPGRILVKLSGDLAAQARSAGGARQAACARPGTLRSTG